MKKINYYMLLISLAGALCLSSCNDNDGPKPALQNPTVTQSSGAYNTLTFEWNKVENAVQYGYRLSSPDGMAVTAGVTHDRTVTITGLQPATTYTLQVWAFASMDGDYSTPPAVTLTATTDPLVPLAAPTGLSLVSENGYIYTASWNAVENALTYTYTVRNPEGALIVQNSTSDTTVSLSDLENGDYTFYVYADGHDGFETGPSVSADFNVDKPEVIEPIYTVTGTYYSAALGTSRGAFMEAFADGTYSIKAFYGVEGYNLDFKVDPSNPDDMFSIINGEYVYDSAMNYYTWQIPTGLSSPSMLIAYPWDNYSYFNGDENGGEVGIGCYYGDNYANWGYDTFTWPADEPEFSIDDICGTYDSHFVGFEYLTDENGVEVNSTWTDYATVSKVNDMSVAIDGLFFTDNPLIGTVNFNDLTITFERKDDYDGYYIVAKAEDPEAPVTGTLNSDGSITIPDWALWYNWGTASEPDWYWYLSGTSELYPSGTSAKLRKLTPPHMAASSKPISKVSPKMLRNKKPTKITGHKREK